MSPSLLLAVAAGGATGAVLRYLTVVAMGTWTGNGFPWGTFTVNLLGSFVLALLIEPMALKWSPSPELRAALVVGVMGSYTTFSTFSLDAYTLFQRGEMATAGAYVLGSVICCLIGFWLGLKLMRVVLA